MPARPKRTRADQIVGKIVFTETGRPIGFEPMNGVAYRIRDLAEIERLNATGQISPEDLERARRAFQ